MIWESHVWKDKLQHELNDFRRRWNLKNEGEEVE